MGEPEYLSVIRIGDVANDKGVACNVAGRSILICKSGDQFFAVENKCSHAEEPLECGRIRYGWISCPAHGARFDLETGEALNPPAKDAIQTFAVRIVGDMIEVAVNQT